MNALRRSSSLLGALLAALTLTACPREPEPQPPQPAPSITEVLPVIGSSAGGTVVTVNGAGFKDVTSVTFGGSAGTALEVVSDSRLTVTTPAGTPGAQDVVVTSPNGSVTASGAFTYFRVPAVTQVQPRAGSVEGGTTVTLTGSGLADVSSVTFGGIAGSELVVVSDGQLTVTTPPGTHGAQDVVVTSPNASTTVSGGYTYHRAPTLTEVQPNTGGEGGGTEVTLTGADLGGTVSVTIGGVEVSSLQVLSDLQVNITTPPGAPGPRDVVVTTPGGTATAAAAFTYMQGPAVSSLAYDCGGTGGGTRVTVEGSRLSGATQVTFGGTAGTELTVLDDTRLLVTTPAGAAGQAEVVVTTPYGSTRVTNGFTYQTPGSPVIQSMTPQGGSTNGGAVVRITGSYLTGATNVRFDGVEGTALNAGCGELVVTTPPGSAGLKGVEVVTPGGSASASGGYNYLQSGIIERLAGTDQGTSENGPSLSAQFDLIYGMALDADGNIFVSDYQGNRVRAICRKSGTYFGVPMTEGNVYTVVGSTSGFSGDGGPALAAKVSRPMDLAFDDKGNLFIADSANSRIRVVARVDGEVFGVTMTAGNIYTVAGTSAGFSGDGGPALIAQLSSPTALEFDASGNLFISDRANHRIRVLARSSDTLFGVTTAANNLYTVVGTGPGDSGDNGPAVDAKFNNAYGLAFDEAGNLYIGAWGNNRVRMVARKAGTYFGVMVAANHIATVAGSTAGFSGDGGPNTAAQLNGPTEITFDRAGNLLISDQTNSKIRLVAKSAGTYFNVDVLPNRIYKIAGTTQGTSGDGGPATSAQLFAPHTLKIDPANDQLVIVDSDGCQVRAINP